jgi:hypothetical protein
MTGADCSGALEPPDDDAPDSLGPDSVGPDGEDPESLDPPDDGSNSMAPDDEEPESLDPADDEEPESLDPADDEEPESLDEPESLGAMGNSDGAAAAPAPEPRPSRLASTPQVTAMPAINRLVFTMTSERSVVSGPVGRRPRCAAARIG